MKSSTSGRSLTGISAAVFMILSLLPANANAQPQAIQFTLGGEWVSGSRSLSTTPVWQRSYTVPAGKDMVIRYVTCSALVAPESTAFILFRVSDDNDNDALVLRTIPTAESVFSSTQHRIAATETTEIYLGIPNQFGPVVADTITIYTQRDGTRKATSVSGLLSCTLSGLIDPL